MKTTFEKLESPYLQGELEGLETRPAGRMKKSNGLRETTSPRRAR